MAKFDSEQKEMKETQKLMQAQLSERTRLFVFIRGHRKKQMQS